jgi:hypothetical protein
VRVSSALGGLRQGEGAAGLSVRAIPGIPAALMVEARVTHDGAGRTIRPAAMVVTELDVMALPGGLEAEIYAQGGYIAGRGATPFGDIQTRVTARAFDRGRVRVDLGGGAWAGGQRGAKRADIGPTAIVSLPLGGGAMRVAADWRLRVAGDALPASGPAVTISAGF